MDFLGPELVGLLDLLGPELLGLMSFLGPELLGPELNLRLLLARSDGLHFSNHLLSPDLLLL